MARRAHSRQDAPRRAGPRLRRGLWAAGLAGASLLHSGCVTTGPLEWVENGFKVGPNYCRPPVPAAPEWMEAKDPRVQKRHLQDWWCVFQDPALNALIARAYDQNLTLRVVGMRILEARAQQAIAAGNIFPQTQQMTGSYSRVNLSRNMANNPAALNTTLAALPGGAQALRKVPPSEIPTSFYSDWTAGFNLSWELDFWGRFRRAVESANAKLDASVEDYDDALVTLLADVATNYVQYRVAQQRIKIARDNVRTQEKLVALAERQQKVGTLTSVDLNQLRTLLEQTRSTIPALEITLGQANDTLCTLLGEPPHDLEPELGPGPDLGSDPVPHTPTWVAAGIPADLLRQLLAPVPALLYLGTAGRRLPSGELPAGEQRSALERVTSGRNDGRPACRGGKNDRQPFCDPPGVLYFSFSRGPKAWRCIPGSTANRRYRHASA